MIHIHVEAIWTQTIQVRASVHLFFVESLVVSPILDWSVEIRHAYERSVDPGQSFVVLLVEVLDVPLAEEVHVHP